MTNSINYNIRDLLDAGVHFGHRTNLWNPKMSSYIFGSRNGIHIIDLQQTVGLLKKGLTVLKNVAKQNGRILFVGTKPQASEVIAEYARKSGQYYVNHRWLGGMLTNWSTVSKSIKTLKGYEDALAEENSLLTKKEKLKLSHKKDKLEAVLGGIRDMGGRPDVLFVIDTNMESLAIKEANKLGIPVVAIADTNSDPDGVAHIIPGNDDARKSIELYCKLAYEAILEGIQEGLSDAGASAEVKAGKIEKDLEDKGSDTSKTLESKEQPETKESEATA